MKKIGLILGGVVALIILAAVMAPSFMDWSRYKQPALDAFQAATGLEAQINGPISVSVFPSPALQLQDLVVKAPGEATGFAQVGAVSVAVDLFPLLSGRVVISSIVLDDPDIKTTLGADGRPSFMTRRLAALMGEKQGTAAPDVQPTQAEETTSAAPASVAIDYIRIRNGHISVTDTRTGKNYTAAQMDVRVSMGSISGPYEVRADVTYQDMPIHLTADLGALASSVQDTPLKLDFSIGDQIHLGFNGSYAPRADGDLQGQLTFKGRDMGEVLKKLAGLSVPMGKGTMDFSALLTASPRNVVMDRIEMKIGATQMAGQIKLRLADHDFPRPLLYARLDGKGILDLRPFMGKIQGTGPVPRKNTGKSGAASFVPSVVLQSPVDVDAQVRLAGVQVGPTPLQDIALDLMVQKTDIRGTMKAGKLPGEGRMSLMIHPESEGSVVLDTDLQVVNAENLLRQGWGIDVPTGGPISNVRDLHLRGQMAMNESGLQARTGILTWSGGDISFAGSGYKIGTRPVLTLTIGGEKLNLDSLMAGKEKAPSAGAMPTTKDSLRSAGSAFALPFDLDAAVNVGSLTAGGFTAKDVGVIALLAGDRLSIQSLDIGAVNGAAVSVRGGISSVSKMDGIDMKMAAQTSDMAAAAQAFKVTGLPAGAKGAARADITYKGSLDRAQVNLSATMGDVTFHTAGQIQDPLSSPQMDNLRVTAQSPRAGNLMRLISGADSSAAVGAMAQPMNVAADVDMQKNKLALKNIDGTLGGMSVKGDVQADFGGARPKISGGLNLGDVPLDSLMGVKNAAEAGNMGGVRASSLSTSGDKINTDFMRAADLDFLISARSINYHLWSLTSPSLAVALSDGRMNIKDLKGGLFGGTFAGGVIAQAPQAGDLLDIALKGTMKDVNARSLTNALMGVQAGKFDGKVGMDVDVRARGASYATLLQNMNGTAHTAGENITINGLDIARLTTWLATDVKPSNAIENLQASFGGGSTVFKTHAGTYAIQNGTANLQSVSFDGDNAQVSSTGVIDFPAWNMNVKTTLKVKQPANVPDISFTLKGPIDRPAQNMIGGAIDSYLQRAVQKKVDKLIQKKLGGKLEKMGLGGVLGGVLGVPQDQAAPQETAPIAQPTVLPSEGAVPDSSVLPQEVAPPSTSVPHPDVPTPEPAPQKIKPEDVLIDVLKGIGK